MSLKRWVSLFSILFTFGLVVQAEAGIFDKVKELLGEKEDKTPVELSNEDIGSGLKEALSVGVTNVVNRLGQDGGFLNDPAIHIPLPGKLNKVKSTLDKVGMGDALDDLENRMNRAAEVATPKAKALFITAIKDMTLDDVMGIYKGSDDAATQYFRGKMSLPLAEEMTPIVDEGLADAGAVKAYDKVMNRYNDIPFTPKVDTDLSGYVVEKGMDGIFHYLAQEEAAIRKDPLKQTTSLLRRVFGS